MNLTPLDIKKQTFDRGLRGYDTTEVEAYLSMLSNEWEQQLRRNEELSKRMQELSEKVKHYENIEQALQQTLNTAEKTASDTVQKAKADADEILRGAKDQANTLLMKAASQRNTMYEQIQQLMEMRKEIISELASVLDHMQSTVHTFSEHQSVFTDTLVMEDLPMIDIEETEAEPVKEVNKEPELPETSVLDDTISTVPEGFSDRLPFSPTSDTVSASKSTSQKGTHPEAADIDAVLDSLDL